jgi:hypothetical protein
MEDHGETFACTRAPAHRFTGAPAQPIFTTVPPCFIDGTAMAGRANVDGAAQAALLEELKAAAEGLGLRVREERLLREVGYRVRSGSCRVGEDHIIFLERDLPVGAQIEILADELALRSLDDVYLSPAARALVERTARKGTSRDEGSEAVGG